MAFSLLPPGADEHSEMAEINVTPLVDVMLVLLIIFMIAAPMLHPGIEVNLPAADSDPLPLRVEDPLVLTMNPDGIVYIRDQPVHPSQLVDRIKPLLIARQGENVFLKADRGLEYGQVMEVLDLLNQGGITDVGLVTQPVPGRR